MIKIVRTDSTNATFIQLAGELDAYLTDINGEADEFYAQFNQIEHIRHVTVAYSENLVPIGCGAMKLYDDDSVEIKRMFVSKKERGKGVAVAMLDELEKWAAELGFSRCVLETGMSMKDAVRLYEKCGFHRIANYGQYAEVEESACFEKRLNVR